MDPMFCDFGEIQHQTFPRNFGERPGVRDARDPAIGRSSWTCVEVQSWGVLAAANQGTSGITPNVRVPMVLLLCST